MSGQMITIRASRVRIGDVQIVREHRMRLRHIRADEQEHLRVDQFRFAVRHRRAAERLRASPGRPPRARSARRHPHAASAITSRVNCARTKASSFVIVGAATAAKEPSRYAPRRSATSVSASSHVASRKPLPVTDERRFEARGVVRRCRIPSGPARRCTSG